jgi:predicted nucleotidyltransferase
MGSSLGPSICGLSRDGRRCPTLAFVDLLDDLRRNRESLLRIDDLADAVGRYVEVVTDAALSPYLRERVLSEAILL